MPHANTISTYPTTIFEPFLRPFYSDQPEWKRIMIIVIPILAIGAGIIFAAKKYFSYISLGELQAILKKEIARIQPIPFAKVKESHETAKRAFSDALVRFNIRSEVRYVKAERKDSTDLDKKKINDIDPLSSLFFRWSRTQGVDKDILAASKNSTEIHLFSVASQYNATEAASPFTPPPGLAMALSKTDRTQGPISQRTNPRLFELVNGYLANKGFNMLAHVLQENSIGALNHGYLTPKDKPWELSVANDFEKNWTRVEQPCVSSYPDAGGQYPVYLMMGAAPAYGLYGNPISQARGEKIQFFAALANFTAEFNQVLHLVKTYPSSKKIVYHAAGIGLGVFGNNPLTVGKAFRIAAAHFQEEFIALEGAKTARVQVQFDVFEREGKLDPAYECVQAIGLEEKK